MRDWARAHPQEYGLVFGSPVPGYDAPPDTVVPASRVPIALARILRDAWDAGTLTGGAFAAPGLGKLLAAVEPLAGLPDDVVATGVLAYVELFGFVSLELFGHLIGTVDDGDAFFALTCRRTAATLGLAERLAPASR